MRLLSRVPHRGVAARVLCRAYYSTESVVPIIDFGRFLNGDEKEKATHNFINVCNFVLRGRPSIMTDLKACGSDRPRCDQISQLSCVAGRGGS